jgi:hypothetical protein
MTLTTIHDRFAFTLLLYLVILFIWGTWRSIRNLSLDANYKGALVIAESIMIIQGILGIYLYFIGLAPERGGMHVLYGIVGALGIPIVFAISKGRNNNQTMMIYTAMLFFVTVIFIRSFVTG